VSSAEPRPTPLSSRPAVLGWVIAAQHIEWGVWSGHARRSTWQALGRIDIDITSDQTPLQALSLGLEHVAQRCAQSAQDWRGATTWRVLVADSWLAASMLPWRAACAQDESLPGEARQHLAQAGWGDVQGDELFRACIRWDEAPYGLPRLVVAYPAELMRALERCAEVLRLRLTSVMPLSLAAWARAGDRQKPALAVLSSDAVVLLGQRSHGWWRKASVSERHARAVSPHQPKNLSEHLSDMWQRLVLREPQWARVGRIELVNLSAEPVGGEWSAPFVPAAQPTSMADLFAATATNSNVNRLDAVRQTAWRGMAHRWAWALLSLLVMGLVLQTVQATRALHRAQTALAARSPASSVTSSRPSPVRLTREEHARVVSVNAAIRALNLPVPALLRAVQVPPELKVAVLSVETTGDPSREQAGLKIAAQASSSADMTDYLAHLLAQKPLTKAHLTQHEWREQPHAPGTPQLHFTLEAQWAD
jgi:hypothetical protein